MEVDSFFGAPSGVHSHSIFGQNKITNLSVPKDTPYIQPGVERSRVGNRGIRTERYQYVGPSSELATGSIIDEYTAQTWGGEAELIPDTFQWRGDKYQQRPRFDPLLREPWLIEQNRRNEYEWRFKGPHNQVEGMYLFWNSRVTAPRQWVEQNPVGYNF